MAQAIWGDTGNTLDRLEYIPRDESWQKCRYFYTNFGRIQSYINKVFQQDVP